MTKEKIELFTKLPRSTKMARENLSGISYEELELEELELTRLGKIIEVFGHQELEGLLRSGFITLAMIKPRADWNIRGLSDLEAVRAIEKEIKTPLEIVFCLAVRFNKEDVEEFYASDQKARMLKEPPIIYNEFESHWEEFVDVMVSGPATFLLLYSPEGNAVEEWRKQIGHWDVEEERDPLTIRGQFAKNNYTSIVHGSDSPDTVLREISFLRDHLVSLLTTKREAS